MTLNFKPLKTCLDLGCDRWFYYLSSFNAGLIRQKGLGKVSWSSCPGRCWWHDSGNISPPLVFMMRSTAADSVTSHCVNTTGLAGMLLRSSPRLVTLGQDCQTVDVRQFPHLVSMTINRILLTSTLLLCFTNVYYSACTFLPSSLKIMKM